MKGIPFLKNRLLVSIISADFWESIRILNSKQISIEDIQVENELAGKILISPKDYPCALELLEKRGDHLSQTREYGPSVYLRKIKQRPILLTGISILSVIFLLLPSRVLYVDVEGNQIIPKKQILSAAQSAGVHIWASRRAIRSETAKNILLSSIPELLWAGVNTYGCRALITVQEQSEKANDFSSNKAVSSIVASRDGIIQSATAQNGTLLCQPGQAVKAGQLLISGYTDCGFCLKAGRAEGEIYAQTHHTLTIAASNSVLRRHNIQTKTRYSFILGKKRINLWKGSGISNTGCGRIYKEYTFTLPGGYRLPVSIACETDILCNTLPELLPSETLEAAMESYLNDYLSEKMIAGTIENARYSLTNSQGYLLLQSRYQCREMIGREHFENGAPNE